MVWRRRWNPFEELEREWRRIGRDLDRMFEELFGRPCRRIGRAAPALEEPLVDVYETDQEVVVVVDLPGVEKKDISVNAMEDTLDISAEAKRAEEAKAPRCINFWKTVE